MELLTGNLGRSGQTTVTISLLPPVEARKSGELAFNVGGRSRTRNYPGGDVLLSCDKLLVHGGPCLL